MLSNVKASDKFAWLLNAAIGALAGIAAITTIGTQCNPQQQPWQAAGLVVLATGCFAFSVHSTKKALRR